MFGPDPSGLVPGVDDAVELDDVFLSGNPLAYFEARIAGLIASTTRPPDLAAEDGLACEYLASLGIRPGDLPVVSDGDRMLQVCLDAFALRHHVAETLVRFIAAVVDSKERKDGTECLWYHASDSPQQLSRLRDRHRAIVGRPDIDSILTEMLLPPTERQQAADDGKLQQALNVMYGWINRAFFLLRRQDLNLNGVANKVKHGLAARARDDLRVDGLPSFHLVDGGIPASVLNGHSTRPLFDAIAVEAIGRPVSGEAFEQTVLMLRPGALLAEAHMMAVVHAAAFHVAAVAHLGERAAFAPPPYPSLPLGPTPEQVHGDKTVGSRRPITFRKDGLATKRGRGLATETHFLPIAELARHGTFMVTDG